MALYCTECGKRAQSGERFCRTCSTYLPWDSLETGAISAIKAPSEQVAPASSGTVRKAGADEQTAAVEIILESHELVSEPGVTVDVSFTVRNLGTRVEAFDLVLRDVGHRDGRTAHQGEDPALPEWLTVIPKSMEIYPGHVLRGTLTSAPPRSPPPLAATTSFQVIATGANAQASDVCHVTVTPVYDVVAELHPTVTRGWGTTAHALLLKNRGNVPLRMTLEAADPEGVLTFHHEPVVELDAFREVQTPLPVRAPVRWAGRAQNKSFDVTVAPGRQPPIRLAGRRVDLPRFATPILVAAGGLTALAVAGLAIVTLGAGKVIPIAGFGDKEQDLNAAETVATATAIPGASKRPGSKPSAGTVPNSAPPANSQKPSPPDPSSTAPQTAVPGRVVIPDVVGETAEQAKGELADLGLTSKISKQISNTVPEGVVLRSDPPAGTEQDAGRRAVLVVSAGPTPLFDLLGTASSAQWRNGDGVTLPFNGNDGDDRGFVLIRENFQLENGETPPLVLETHPQWIPDGVIEGSYALRSPVIRGDHFRAKVGFIAGAAGSVRFDILVDGGDACDGTVVHSIDDSGPDRVVRAIDVDLSACEGATSLRLRATTIGSGGQQWAVWLDPRVEGVSS
ncbi:MAG TPA: PASTA domain-containing protein [Kineosporiaceae bacterium]|nr:PASTA domain-containing protein [Kineosporiaceae bacterium]